MASDRKEHSFRFSGWNYHFTTDNGVFSKTKVDEGTQIFLDVLKDTEMTDSLLDMGCGYGVIGIVMKHLFPDLSVTCVDVNPRAVELTEYNAEVNRAEIRTFLSDGFAGIEEQYANIVTNPPIRAGKKVIYKMFADAYAHLNTSGSLYVVIRRQQGAESAVKELERLFSNCTVMDRKKGYWILHSLKLTD